MLILLFPSSTIQAEGLTDNEIPSLGNASSNLISIEQEKRLGKAWLRGLRQYTSPYNNPLIEDYLNNLIYSLAPNSEVIDRDFSIVVIDNPTLNAFAVPGSIIGINSGLFLHAASEQEFASVLAHELAHLGQRHYARQLEQQQLSAPLTLAGVLASILLAATTGSDAGIAALASTQALSADQQLRFSRKNEQEADRLGIKTLQQSNYDPRAMPAMFERMFRTTRHNGESLPEYLSTHPLSENRISDTRNRANQYPVKQYHDNIEFHFSKNIIISDYAESTSRAISHFNSIIKKGNTSQVQAAKFGLAYASIDSNPERSIALIKELLQAFPNKISLNITYAKALQKNKQKKLAIKTLERLLERNPNNYSVSYTLSEMYLQNDRIDSSEKLLLELSRSQNENPKVWYLLAEVHGLAGHIVDLHMARAEFFYLTNRLDKSIAQLKLAMQKNTANNLVIARIQKRMDELLILKNQPIL